MPSCGMLSRVALIRTDVSKERSPSIIRVTISELGTMLAVTSNRGTLRAFLNIILCNKLIPCIVVQN
jgi:hypothetical protein